MDHLHLTGARADVRAPARRLVAAGIIRRRAGRTFTVRVTPAGVTGSIRPTGGAR